MTKVYDKVKARQDKVDRICITQTNLSIILIIKGNVDKPHILERS
jgi:hypothetical protein